MEILTKNKYKFFECSSALQKAIRRNIEKDALFFMTELYLSGYGEYVWKRLKIIVSEDVGLAEPNMAANIHALYMMYNEQKVKSKGAKTPERLFLVQAVVMLCRAKKSRLIDWYVIKLFREHDSNLIDVPDYAFDMHNIRGKIMGRGLDHFYSDSSKLENHHPQELELEVKKAAYFIHKAKPMPTQPNTAVKEEYDDEETQQSSKLF